MACLDQGLCQTPDVQVYETFFLQVAESKSGDTFYPPSPVQPIVLTEYENQALRILATDCKSKLRSLKAAISSLRLEIIFQSIQLGQASETTRQQFADLQAQQPKMVLEYFQLLKVIFGDSRFQMVQEFVRTWEPEKGSPFGMPAPPPIAKPAFSPHKK